jgi:hypothetical protein
MMSLPGLKGQKKTAKYLRITGHWAEMWPYNFLNTKQERRSLNRDFQLTN